jgi:HD superfamily phosphohydrolase
VLAPSAAQAGVAVTEQQALAAEVAALLHDVGHGPSSHTIEDALRLEGRAWTHEDASEMLIRRLFAGDAERLAPLVPDCRGDGDLARFVNLVVALVRPTKSAVDALLPPSARWLAQVVSSYVDVDRSDYFMRDARACGTPIPFDAQNLLGCARVMLETQGDPSSACIAWNARFQERLVLAFKTRFQLYSDVYLKPCNRRLEMMERDALRAALREGYRLPDGRTLLDATADGDSWLHATDAVYADVLARCAQYPLAAAALLRILNGQLYRPLLDLLVSDERRSTSRTHISDESVRALEAALAPWAAHIVMDTDTISNGLGKRSSVRFPVFTAEDDGTRAALQGVGCTVHAMVDTRLRVYLTSSEADAASVGDLRGALHDWFVATSARDGMGVARLSEIVRCV